MNKLANQNHRKTHAQGYSPFTRATNLINQQAQLIKKHSETYTRSRNALLQLGFDSDNKDFQELKDEDCYTKAMFREQRQKRASLASAKKLSWIWRVGWDCDPDEDTEWNEEVQRVQWFLSRAQKERWEEEVEIIEEEMKRVIHFFAFFSKVWKSLVHVDAVTPDHLGPNAYALKTAAHFAILEAQARSIFVTYISLPPGKEQINMGLLDT
ncbi:hypothetical protein M422DRAFT_265956 [Sphaerobolus stellatus SS14]|uniref:Uncharacterized protein n=1 Tax=Sphaerobolus stellatus (strain SS14) TaxID=990650 RepID=A0A0C9UC93_SPHS4|nr:hypothetical protein M422DRAFT_265956 [Sphaerobolus stellatus SS14]